MQSFIFMIAGLFTFSLFINAQPAVILKTEYPDYCQEKDVHHGEIREIIYFSVVANSKRRILVHLPAGYNAIDNKKYPVLYLLHGGGEDEEGWILLGRGGKILDNLIAAGKAVPMIVVMPNGRLSDPVQSGGYNWEIGIFSAGVFGGSAGTPENFNIETEIPGILTDAKSFSNNFNLIFISVGEQDERINFTTPVVEKLHEKGLDVVYQTYPEGHEWIVWVKSLYEFAQIIFKI